MSTPVKYHTGKFPPDPEKGLNWPKLIPLIGPASAALARFDGVLRAIPNSQVLLSPLSTQEAVLSSRIEGTQATMGEVLQFEAGATPEKLTKQKEDDIHEVINYRRALTEAVDNLERIPISLRLIKKAHQTLLTGVRGDNKMPGEFRRIQNFIGAHDSKIEHAKFIPIQQADLDKGMSRWEKFIHEEPMDFLVHLALLHVEFESLHPFMDGNGRLGRMLIPLFLFEKNVLSRPVFYMSAWLEAHREEYYEYMRAVSRDDAWTAWCAFFLQGIREQAAENCKKAEAIVDLHKQLLTKISDATKSHNATRALDFFFDRPIFSSSDFVEKSKIPAPTARRFLRVLTEKKVLKVFRKGMGTRATVLVLHELLNIAEGKRVF